MKKLLKIILIILFLPISLPILIIKSKMPKALKIILIILHIAFWAWLIFSPSKYTAEELAATKTARVALTPTKTEAPEPTATEPPTETQIPTDTPVPTDTPEPKPTKEVIAINGETAGTYGKTVTTNKGTENELSYIGYFVPAGKYNATNHRNYPGQINVYNPETVWEDGIEYPGSGGGAYLIQSGETKEIEVPEGFYIKVVPPEDFTITAVD